MKKNYLLTVISWKANFFTFLSISLLSTSALTLDLSPYETNYFSKAKSFDIETVRTLEKINNKFQVKQEASAMLMKASETSTFSVLDDGNFVPESYFYNRKIMGNNRLYQTKFSPSDKTAAYEEKGKTTKKVTFTTDIYDVLSYQEKMRADLLSHDGNLTIPIYTLLDKGRVREYKFKTGETEWLKTDVGYLHTLKIERVRDKDDKHTTIWLAKDWGYVIVKALHREKDEKDYEMKFVGGTYDGKKIAGEKVQPQK